MELNEYTKPELIDIIVAYNKYVMTFYEEHDEGSHPVCIYEFIDNEYQCY